ncbi:phosphate acyltransferase PlsX [Pelagicoccus sp. SDUM812003]|uniref:phosphate acyltransferase PlsX n=1 Tax=Pelagicoccus sp. SDUM812003 TaxID=3041267 RepID=UPI0028100193|nr:phosphate acyltransferase PlsX [Pelagicoccus sp. SDUM812003]MDQ8201975.1 phosphate acyltransferase PlsX [Pelagicoccus sp. SDUM812003]
MLDQASSGIAVDAMGSDKGPAEMVAAVKMAVETLANLRPIILVGDEAILKPLLEEAGLSSHPKVSTFHASEVIAMDDKPLIALKRKKDASMVRAIELVKDGHAGCVVSCGNTGSLMAGGTLKLRTLDGVDRPALASVMPRKTGHFVLIDAGANPLAKAEHLVHNAILGSNYCKHVLGVERPKVGLMTIGTEEGKGTDLTNQAHALLKKIPDLIDYHGPIEGFQTFEEGVDVVVCDGFTGNILLKASESLFMLLKDFVSEELKKNAVRKLGYLLSKGAFDAIKNQLKPERYGGAPLLGLKGNVLKAHGSSNREAVMNAIRIANEIISNDLKGHILSDIETANSLI